MKAKITVFLMALALVFPAQNAEARVIKQEQSWLDKIFSNDQPEMIQKSPFSQPQMKKQNPRIRQPQKQTYTHDSEARTQVLKQPENTTRVGRHTHTPKNDLSHNYAERIQTLRQQRLNAMKGHSATSSSGVND